MEFETWYRSTLAAKLNSTDITCTVANAPTVTEGRMHVYKGNTHAWIKFTGVSGSTLTWVTFVSQTTDPITTVAWTTFPAGSNIELVAMHDQMFNAEEGGTITGDVTITWDFNVTGDSVFVQSMKVPVYADATARDVGIPTPANGMIIYNTALGILQQYIAGSWASFATGSVVNADQTTAGKVEMATTSEVRQGTDTWWTGASLVFTPSQFQAYYPFGDGSDGSATISTNTSLTRDMYYDDLTVNTWVTLDPAGYAIYVRWTLTLTWTWKIARNWNNWSNGTNAVAWTSAWAWGSGWAALATGTCWANTGGSAGWNGWDGSNGVNGTAGTAVSTSYAAAATTSAAAWAWGTWSGGGGYTGWTAWATAAVAARWTFYNTYYNLGKLLGLLAMPARAAIVNTTAYGWLPSWGGGGWGASWNAANAEWGGWGGSGGTGGIIVVIARWLAGTWSIESIGWAGGNGGNGAGAWFFGWGGGGWAGWSGGIIFLVYNSGSITTTVTGGAGGTWGAAGGAGATAWGNGATGTTWTVISINV